MLLIKGNLGGETLGQETFLKSNNNIIILLPLNGEKILPELVAYTKRIKYSPSIFK